MFSKVFESNNDLYILADFDNLLTFYVHVYVDFNHNLDHFKHNDFSSVQNHDLQPLIDGMQPQDFDERSVNNDYHHKLVYPYNVLDRRNHDHTITNQATNDQWNFQDLLNTFIYLSLNFLWYRVEDL